MEVVKLKEAPRQVRFHDDLEPYLNKDNNSGEMKAKKKLTLNTIHFAW